MCRILIAQDPEWNYDNEESGEMSEEGDDFECRQDLGTPSVEEDRYNKKRQHDQRVLPIWKCEVGISDFNHGLDLGCDDKSAACDTGKPAQGRHPSYKLDEIVASIDRRHDPPDA